MATVFDISASTDPDGSIASHSWNYGDGENGTSDSHTYAVSGAYTATLTVTDNRGASSTATLVVPVAKCSASGTQAALSSPYPTVCMQSSKGEIVLEFYPSEAPATVANFLQYVDDGYYAGTLFHRVIPDFVIQGGGFLPGMVAKTPAHAPIPLESNNGLQNWQYTVAMARTSVPDSATSQFFVNLVDNHNLDYDAAQTLPNGYAVFGQVISGRSVVDTIGSVATATSAGFTDVPTQDVVIKSAVRMP